jgi:hypothetical protein
VITGNIGGVILMRIARGRMSIVVVLLSLAAFARPSDADNAPALRMFYCIHAVHECVRPDDAAIADRARSTAIAAKALSRKDDFVGFIDSHDATLQFYVDRADSIRVDMPVPERKGSYTIQTSRAEALQIIASLSPPLSRYRTKLNLKFAKWE